MCGAACRFSWRARGCWKARRTRRSDLNLVSRSVLMMPFAPALLASGLFLTVADNVPTYNMQPTCRAAIEMMDSQGRTLDSCMRSEAEARKEIVKHWPQVPQEEKTRCMQTALQG